MARIVRFLAIFCVLLVAIFALYYFTTLRHEAPEVAAGLDPVDVTASDCTPEDSGCREILDCQNSAGPCSNRRVRFDAQACERKSRHPNRCANLARRFDSITLRTDRYNLIDSPLSKLVVVPELVPSELKNPWDLEFLPDGSMMITEKGGRVVHIDDQGVQKVLLEIPVINEIETGMMGLAIDPGFAGNRFVYIAYAYRYGDDLSAWLFSYLKDGHAIAKRVEHRISRFTFTGDALENEVVILDDIPGSLMHAGLRLEFGPDGKLYATTGDAGLAQPSQVVSFLGGKILRMNPDGSIPDDNPFSGSYVYSLGHRNPQGIAWDEDTGSVYSAEHGSERMDEVNRIEPGGNYGWGSFSCENRTSWLQRPGKSIFPLFCYRQWNISPSGMTFVSDKTSPWHGSLFVASLRGGHVHRFVFEGERAVIDEIFYISDGWDYEGGARSNAVDRRIRDVEYHDGALYVMGDNYGIAKLSPAATDH
jgi:glucose/arabinose dehydrogenase